MVTVSNLVATFVSFFLNTLRLFIDGHIHKTFPIYETQLETHEQSLDFKISSA